MDEVIYETEWLPTFEEFIKVCNTYGFTKQNHNNVYVKTFENNNKIDTFLHEGCCDGYNYIHAYVFVNEKEYWEYDLRTHEISEMTEFIEKYKKEV